MYHTFMSKGLGRLQRSIVGLLEGTLSRRVFAGSGPLTTDELLAELEERGLVRAETSRKVRLFTVRRACISLLDRGVLEGEYILHPEYPWARVLSWSVAKRKD
jgi:hypothetical protein